MRCKIDPLLHAYFFFALLCFVSAFLSWEGMIWRWKENFLLFLSHSFCIFILKAAMIFFFNFFFAPKCLWRKYFDATNEKPRICCVNKKYSSLIGYLQFLFVYAQRRFLSDSRKLQILSSRYFLLQKTFCFYAKKKSPKLITGLFSFRIGKVVPDRGSGMNEWGFDGGYF